MSLLGNFVAGNVTRVIADKVPLACMPPRVLQSRNRRFRGNSGTSLVELSEFGDSDQSLPVRRFHLRR